MELSLKKARKLETKIGAFIAQQSSNFEFQFDARINDDVANVEKQAIAARTQFLDSLKNLDNLNVIRYGIRSDISKMNSQGASQGELHCSIDELLNEKVQLETKTARLNAVLRFEKFDRDLMEDELNNNKKAIESGAASRGYNRTSSTFDVNFLTALDEQEFKDEKLKVSKRIEEIEDKLAELNYSKRISLGANSVKLLQDNGLL